MSLATQLTTALKSTSLPLPSPQTITALLTSPNAPTTLPPLLQRTKHHILTSDLTTPSLLDPSTPSFPTNLLSPQTREAKLPHSVPFQVLDIEDLSRSRWEQVEELERVERGEMTRGRAVVRLERDADEEENQPVDDNSQAVMGPPPPQASSRNATLIPGQGGVGKSGKSATHRVVLQDWKGTRVFGLELTRMERLGLGATRIGEKIVMKSGATIARGVLLLEPATCVFLGGHIEALEKEWAAERLNVLKEGVGGNPQ